MATIKISSSQVEDAFVITAENGQVIEAVVVHIPGDDKPMFHLGTYNSNDANIEDSYQELFTCPVQAA